MLNSTRPIIDGGNLMLEPSLHELILIFVPVKHLRASSLCLASLTLRGPRRLMLVDHVWHVLRHAEKVIGKSTHVLRWNDLVHTDVEVLRLLQCLRVVLWGRGCSWNHWTYHVHSMAISLSERVLHWLVHHELTCSSALVARVVQPMMTSLSYSLRGLSWELSLFLPISLSALFFL